MKQANDTQHAQRLVPLLDAIFREVADRRREVRLLEKQLAAAKRDDAAPETMVELRAQLATHRRELRLSRREFEHLGCVVDEHNPNRVLILGPNGRRDFRWDAGDPAVTSTLSDATSGA